jgi:heme exporter protein C
VTTVDSRPDRSGAETATTRATGSTATRVLGLVVLAGLAVVGWLGFFGSPADATMGETVRLMYVHVPVVSVAYTACAVTTGASVVWLFRRTEWWDLVASSSAEIATVFTALTLVTGMLWGRPTWGVFWVWDARLTSTAMLFLLLLGYLAIRRVPAAIDVRNRRSAVVGLLLLPNVLIVNRSVTWWRSVHQDATVLKASLEPDISGLMFFTLMFAMAVAYALYVWLMIHRFRVAYLEDRVDEAELADAIGERRAEGQAS